MTDQNDKPYGAADCTTRTSIWFSIADAKSLVEAITAGLNHPDVNPEYSVMRLTLKAAYNSEEASHDKIHIEIEIDDPTIQIFEKWCD